MENDIRPPQAENWADEIKLRAGAMEARAREERRERVAKIRQAAEGVGCTVTSGIKYGSDLLVYLGDVADVHASASLSVCDRVSFRALSGMVRVTSSVKKDAIIAEFNAEQSCPAYFIKCRRFVLESKANRGKL